MTFVVANTNKGNQTPRVTTKSYHLNHLNGGMMIFGENKHDHPIKKPKVPAAEYHLRWCKHQHRHRHSQQSQITHHKSVFNIIPRLKSQKAPEAVFCSPTSETS